ncbi:DUF2461 domain-containing protein [Taibaiella helva]|uniref:DUF2461 domain-containing protein n=1 Tax=Taibaiella helva TaxID=2301235 RepID=UPI000E57956C|nr:DUF2461 domain-containing protein [Taibaiella helva]
MIAQTTLQFLKQLKQNNNKEWMDAHRKEYEAAKADYERFVADILEGLSAFEPLFRDIPAKQCMFRINRDIRFSEDKSPYKTNFGAHFTIGGKKSPHAGFYFHLEPGSAFVGGGSWMPPADMLKNIRQEIDYDLAAFEKIIHQKDFKKLYPRIDGEQLKKAPQGYDPDNPAIEYLRYKSFTVGHPLSDKELSDKNLARQTIQSFRTMKPFIDFLNRAVPQ